MFSRAFLGLGYYFLVLVLVLLFDEALEIPVGSVRGLIYMLAVAVLAPFHMHWIHSSLTKAPARGYLSPSKIFAQFSLHNYKQILLPSLASSGAHVVTILALVNAPGPEADFTWLFARHILTMAIVALVLIICLILPTNIALTRTEAALFPLGNESLVTIDRSFAVMGERNSMQDSSDSRAMVQFARALRSVHRSIVVRKLKEYLKWSFALLCTLLYLFAG